MKTLKDKTLDQINNFSIITVSLCEYIKKHWKGNIKPKGYKKFLEYYEDYEGMEELDSKSLEDDFKGFDDSSATMFSFPINMSLPHVAYNDTNQGRSPLRTLVSSVLRHGMIIGERRGELKALKALEGLHRDFKMEVEISKETGKEVSMRHIDSMIEHYKKFGF